MDSKKISNAELLIAMKGILTKRNSGAYTDIRCKSGVLAAYGVSPRNHLIVQFHFTSKGSWQAGTGGYYTIKAWDVRVVDKAIDTQYGINDLVFFASKLHRDEYGNWINVKRIDGRSIFSIGETCISYDRLINNALMVSYDSMEAFTAITELVMQYANEFPGRHMANPSYAMD